MPPIRPAFPEPLRAAASNVSLVLMARRVFEMAR
jgi:hypothetical protein